MTRTALLLLTIWMLSACGEKQRLIRGCEREHGSITVEEYLQERDLTDCPDTPDASCTGEILSAAAIECVAWELYFLEVEDSQDVGNVQSGFSYTIVHRFSPVAIAYSSEPDFDDLIWAVGGYEYGEDVPSGTWYFGARTGFDAPLDVYVTGLSTPF